MKKELQDKLYQDYPKIFLQHKLPMSETCMCWGVECGDGWYLIIDLLCRLLQWDIDRNGHPQIEATQVKEKFGGLRFYTNHADEYQSGMISYVSQLSNYICEQCGSTDEVSQTKGYIITLCKKCIKEY
jgi:hypothetical protein